MQRHDFTIGPNNPRAQLYATGFYIRYRASSFEVENEIRIEGAGFDVVMIPGQAMRLPIKQSLWSITAGPNNIGALVTDMKGELIIGDGAVDDDSVSPPIIQVSSTGHSIVDRGIVTASQLFFTNGSYITKEFPKRAFKSASFRHDGASPAWVDIFMTPSPGGITMANYEMALNSTGFTDTATPFRYISSLPSYRVFLDRAYMPAKGSARVDWFFPPIGNVLFVPNVQAGDTLSQLSMSLVSYQI